MKNWGIFTMGANYEMAAMAVLVLLVIYFGLNPKPGT